MENVLNGRVAVYHQAHDFPQLDSYKKKTKITTFNSKIYFFNRSYPTGSGIRLGLIFHTHLKYE